MQTPESNLQALAIRVATLETQNRYLKRVGTAALLLVGVMAAALVVASRVIWQIGKQQHSMVLTTGVIHASLIQLGDDEDMTTMIAGAIRVQSKKSGKRRSIVGITASDDGPSVALSDNAG